MNYLFNKKFKESKSKNIKKLIESKLVRIRKIQNSFILFYYK
jgi:hypothetical protein